MGGKIFVAKLIQQLMSSLSLLLSYCKALIFVYLFFILSFETNSQTISDCALM